ncbi:MAG: hypothetical protein ISS47_03980 [Candidatus Omnitrophica bacterium]|nr:hypothetical protein [Candidatus Omnitrophota bacterium]
MNIAEIIPDTQDGKISCSVWGRSIKCNLSNLITALLLLLFGILLLNLFYFFHYSYLALTYPYSMNRLEGTMWASIVCSKFVSLYPDYSIWPYMPTAYPPVFYLLAMFLHNVFHMGISAGRIVSLISAIGTAFIFARLCYTKSQNRFFSIIFFMLFFANESIYHWGLLYRVDMLSIFFIGLALYFGLAKDCTVHNQIVSCIFLFFAFFTKSTFVAPIVVLFCYWSFIEYTRNRNADSHPKVRIKTLLVGGLFLGVVILMLLILQAVTDGRYVKHVFGLMVGISIFNIERGIDLFRLFICKYWPLIIYVAILFFSKCREKKMTPKVIFQYIGLCLALLQLFIAGSRMGSDYNYYLEPCLWLFFIISTSMAEMWQRKVIYTILLICLIRFAFISVPFPRNPFLFTIEKAKHATFAMAYFKYDTMVKDEILDLISKTEKNVLTEDAAIAIRAGKTPIFEPFLMNKSNYMRLWNWNSSDFIKEMKNGNYKYIVVQCEFTKSKFISDLLREYFNRILNLYTPNDDSCWGENYLSVYEFVGKKRD